jgi:hypothetical protein
MAESVLDAVVDIIKPVAATVAAEPENPADFIEVHGTRVDLLENAVRLHLSNGMTKMVSYADFSQTVLSFLDKAQESKSTTLRILPSNVYLIEESIDRLNLCFYFPEKIQNVNYLGEILPRVVPNIILNVSLTRGTGGKKLDFKYHSATYYATNLPLARLPREKITKSGPGISILPFTNVYDNATLCTGSNSLITDFLGNDLRGTIWYHDMLWASPFNNDIGVIAIKSNSDYRGHPASWYAHLAKLAKDGKGFPYDQLEHTRNAS